MIPAPLIGWRGIVETGSSWLCGNCCSMISAERLNKIRIFSMKTDSVDNVDVKNHRNLCVRFDAVHPSAFWGVGDLFSFYSPGASRGENGAPLKNIFISPILITFSPLAAPMESRGIEQFIQIFWRIFLSFIEMLRCSMDGSYLCLRTLSHRIKKSQEMSWDNGRSFPGQSNFNVKKSVNNLSCFQWSN